VHPRVAGVEEDPGGRANEHARDGARPVPVLAQEVADAFAVACRDVGLLAWMLDDEGRVVLDPRARVERADQVVDLLARRRRQAQMLVEGADALDELASQEDRERDRAVPEILAGESRRLGRPPGLAAGDPVEPREPVCDALEEIGWIDTVVVRKGDCVSAQLGERRVPRARQPGLGAEPHDTVVEQRDDPVVGVLVDDEHAKVSVRLRAKRGEEPFELRRASDGRNDEVESHGRTLTPVPLVSVLLAVHDDTRFLGEAVDSVLRQTLADLELILVDDGSSQPLQGFDDPRVTLLRNDERLGLAASLNRGLDAASGTYVARLDADDVALPNRLERQVGRLGAGTAVVGSAIVDVDERGTRGRTHVMPSGATPLRWHALFSSPFFHPSVLVDREVLDRHGLRYDPSFEESEDYDLWTRLFEYANGDNLREALVLKRVHPGQASLSRRDVQESFQRRVALREIGRYAVDAEAVWRGSRRELLRLLRAFERRHGPNWDVRKAAFKALVR
jgi:glycosyltransferase involved in cell wall biosynthesis